MKLKYLAAACAMLGSSASFAAGIACDTATAVTFTNTCAPDATLFIAGSSALGGALTTVVPPDLFDTTTMPIIKIKDTSTGTASQAAATIAWYGMSIPAVTGGTSRRLFVVYNNNNGSAAGPSVMLTKAGTFNESIVVNVGPSKTGANTCVADAASTTLVPVVNCTSVLARQADLGITDTHPLESYAVYVGVKLGTLAKPTLVATPLAMQGFGVAVNANLYSKLQTQQIASGELDATCAPGSATALCQPSIRSAQYSSLIAQDGSVKTAAALVGDSSDTSTLVLARRDDLSGTQATSNLFFARNGCGGIGYDAATKSFNRVDGAAKASKANFAVLGGGLDIISSTTLGLPSSLTVQANATTSNVRTALNSASGYAIGVLGLNVVPGGSDTFKYVKLDGVSPNFSLAGVADSKQRVGMISGRYQFQVVSYASVLPKPAGSLKIYPELAQAVITGLKDSTLHNLAGIGYLDGVVAAQQSTVTRINGNNCSPLVLK